MVERVARVLCHPFKYLHHCLVKLNMQSSLSSTCPTQKITHVFSTLNLTNTGMYFSNIRN